MNGWLLVRIAGIVVGIATLLRVATNEGIVTYDPLFLAWMDRLRDIVELGFLTDLIGPVLHWGIEQVRSLGISVPDLQDEWQPAFVLSTLMFAAVARHSRSGLLVAAAPVAALAFAFWSGLVGSLYPVGAAAGFVGTFFPLLLPGARNLAFVVVAAAASCLFVASLGLAGLDASASAAAAVAGGAVLILIAGIYERLAGGLRADFSNPYLNIGIDILFTMTSAFMIAVAASNPPIW